MATTIISHCLTSTMTDIIYSKEVSAPDASVKKIFRVKPYENSLRFDLREWKEDRPTRRGVSMPMLRFVSLMQHEEAISTALGKVMRNDPTVDESFHIGGNLYVSIKAPYWLVDFRQHFLDDEFVLRPTRKGLKLKLEEWNKFKTSLEKMKEAVPETSGMEPCYASDSHLNQAGFRSCKECCPNALSLDDD